MFSNLFRGVQELFVVLGVCTRLWKPEEPSRMTHPVTDVYQEITGADASVRDREARNGVRHMVSLSMTKVADGLIDPKLVLSWLAGALGAPAALTGPLPR